jgi:glycosyltransferase involved in cell wall biosynthesis
MKAYEQQTIDHAKISSISVIIPALNEEKTIGMVIERTKRALKPYKMPSEIIIVDDGSADETHVIASKLKVKVLRNKTRQGKGSSLRRGFNEAQGDIIVTLDADGAHQPEEIPLLLTPILEKNFDLVIGSRQPLNTSLVNKVGNKIFGIIITFLYGKRFIDTQCGFRSFKTTILKEIQLLSTKFDIESEFLIKSVKHGYNIYEQQITCKSRIHGDSRLRSISDGLKILLRILAS